ncbi:MAG TPA: hypothetical protein VM925_30520 [Labilithrix sp.]|nr:hypothetical protein [Labilithrix sp.]
MTRFHFGFLVFCVGLVACSVTAAAPGSSGGTSPAAGGASASEIAGCKEACDKMKFFRCNSAEEQARCYEECEQAAPNKIELFTACAESSVCDPACRTNIKPAPSPVAGQPAGTVTGGGASESSCTTACKKLVGCSYIKISDEAACVTECKAEAYQFQIDCINGNECADMPKTCGGGGGGGGSDQTLLQCQATCDNAQFLDCFDASQHAGCRAACEAAEASDRSTYSSCAGAATDDCKKHADCYSQLAK